MSIYDDLTNARRAHHLTQLELAKRTKLSRMTVSNAEAGKDPRMSTVLEMARTLGMDLMLVPKGLRTELENFIQSGGRMLGQQAGVDAPKSVVESISLFDPAKVSVKVQKFPVFKRVRLDIGLTDPSETAPENDPEAPAK